MGFVSKNFVIVLAMNNKCAAMNGGTEKNMNQLDSIMKDIEHAIRRNKYYESFKNYVNIDDCKKMVEHLFNTNFEDYCPWTSGFHQIIASDVFKILYPMIPEDKKFSVTMDYHLCNPAKALGVSSFKDIIDIMVDVKKYRPDENIEPLRELVSIDNTLTVFRGSTRKEKNPEKSLSWTIKKSVAISFATDFHNQNNGYIYTAAINIDDVIGYCDVEFQVIQYDSVVDIKGQKL